MTRWTIRARLTLLYGGLFLLAGAMLLTVTYLLVQQSLERRIGPRGDLVVRMGTGPPGGGPNARVIMPDGREITLDQIAREYARREDQFRRQTLNSLLTQGGIALGGVGVMAIGLGWLMSERVLRPVHQISATARRVASGNLHERIGLSGPRDEVKELADTFDSMLERLDQSFDGQRRFVANASHELRTPLAINRTLLEVALGRPDAGEQLRQLAETLLAVNARHERLIDGLLTLAQSEQQLTARDLLDLADIAGHVTTQTDGVELRLDLRPAPTLGDPILLERVVQNLVANAIAYNITDGWVAIETDSTGSLARLIVTNTGPVIPAYEVPGLFEPFRRLVDRTGSAHGTGLGLSIVRSVTIAHGGAVRAVPRDGGGLVVTIEVPIATATM
jgi:signal transduction histidine kinase